MNKYYNVEQTTRVFSSLINEMHSYLAASQARINERFSSPRRVIENELNDNDETSW